MYTVPAWPGAQSAANGDGAETRAVASGVAKMGGGTDAGAGGSGDGDPPPLLQAESRVVVARDAAVRSVRMLSPRLLPVPQIAVVRASIHAFADPAVVYPNFANA
jgi:hypothetical protein